MMLRLDGWNSDLKRPIGSTPLVNEVLVSMSKTLADRLSHLILSQDGNMIPTASSAPLLSREDPSRIMKSIQMIVEPLTNSSESKPLLRKANTAVPLFERQAVRRKKLLRRLRPRVSRRPR